MTYTIARISDEEFELRDEAGNVITTKSAPLTTPTDIIDDILEDLRITEPISTAIKTLVLRDWEIVDER